MTFYTFHEGICELWLKEVQVSWRPVFSFGTEFGGSFRTASHLSSVSTTCFIRLRSDELKAAACAIVSYFEGCHQQVCTVRWQAVIHEYKSRIGSIEEAQGHSLSIFQQQQMRRSTQHSVYSMTLLTKNFAFP
ncbi:hypothetical protein AVEN_68135-1 [Araneus ventricosus]|uniref:Uncharacterized protein n=1 Tax=Araneus ventricosus TaxID=182803 RepID=A0A4Y2T0S5_ARAVE|nr:hypothetical protein AVEN_68135-1 [Araneus ventricosus]